MIKNNFEWVGSKRNVRTLFLALLIAFPAFFVSAPESLLAAGSTDGSDAYGTAATNRGSITNTRHNLTQSFASGAVQDTMTFFARNNYNEICVYCHTPHGANKLEGGQLPLWNHTIPTSGSFTTYESTALGGGITDWATNPAVPGPASMTCLSCHDGTIAVDSIINMPTTDTLSLYDPAADDAISTELGNWVNPTGDPATASHFALGPFPSGGCLFCHQTGGILSAPSFQLYSLGKDLTNDHPVGIVYPAATGPFADFKQPSDTTTDGRITYFEDAVGGAGLPSSNANNRLNTNEIRLYNSSGVAGAFEVECASCHDPHGVPSDGSTPWSGAFNTPGLSRTGTRFNSSFLRISNSDSDVCLTCHDK